MTDRASTGERIDVWLDVACLFKTRSEAQRACRGGKVDVNGESTRPNRIVRPGDEIVLGEARLRIKFDEHGEKKFISSMAIPNLKKSDRQPPVEKRATRARKKAAPAPAATTNAVES